MADNVTKRKPRLFYLDWVRGLSAILIVITHFNNPYLVEHPIFANSPFGIYIGSLGVSQFLIISGAALMYSHEDAEKLDLKEFYWKRCKSIFPMFWIAFIIANVYLFLRQGGIVAAQAPKYSVLLSVIGMDGYLSNAGIPTFYTLGEWFLGFYSTVLCCISSVEVWSKVSSLDHWHYHRRVVYADSRIASELARHAI